MVLVRLEITSTNLNSTLHEQWNNTRSEPCLWVMIEASLFGVHLLSQLDQDTKNDDLWKKNDTFLDIISECANLVYLIWVNSNVSPTWMLIEFAAKIPFGSSVPSNWETNPFTWYIVKKSIPKNRVVKIRPGIGIIPELVRVVSSNVPTMLTSCYNEPSSIRWSILYRWYPVSIAGFCPSTLHPPHVWVKVR